ncbi:MAG TPA: MBL fold metallo-hydrolase [Candidatus Limnocylindrales bacterium]|nr:MBL fold metallo-hydrolase [Candidatus Limnocylindrales bacterium]
MRLVRYGHACARIEEDGRALVVDPGCWTEPAALAGAQAVLITHEHEDHIDPGPLAAAMAASPALRVYGPAAALATVVAAADGAPQSDRLVPVHVGERFDAAGWSVRAFGGRHAPIWQGRPDVANLSYLVDERVYVPGDALVPPGVPVDRLFVPVHGSWMKTDEAIAFARAVAPRHIHPIHDGQLNERGLRGACAWLAREGGADFARLPIGGPIELDPGS